jgi:transcriptional regulator with XRE-family HTH domain
MSTNHDSSEIEALGVPELTPLGKRIELLRIDRRMSKGILAQRAGTSRQQLWRVMTGKSELTSSLCARLADVLEVDSRVLREAERDAIPGDPTGAAFPRQSGLGRALDAASVPNRIAHRFTTRHRTLEEYVSDADGLARTFETLPGSDDGRRLKRALLNEVEDIAQARALKLPPSFFDLRRRVVNDEV